MSVKPVPHSASQEQPAQAAICLRADLIMQRTPGVGGQWVVKDPLSNDFHFFSDAEMKVMRALDGRPLSDVLSSCALFFRNEYLSTEGLVAFIADIQKRGLLKLSRPEKKRGIGDALSPLAIRLPGFNPEQLLDRLYHLASWIFHPFTMTIVCVVIASAIVRIMFQADQLIRELPDTSQWLTTAWAWNLVIVIGAMKVIHELAHGLTCRHFGGRCTEMGLMLLVFVPCMYCDVSDTWLLPNRWKRIAVSAAGICAELFLASCAALVWSLTTQGSLHSICLAIMLVGSIKTILFNGNPLMRYDGYFILSDLLRIPNLFSEARQYLATKLRTIFLLTPVAPSKPRVASGWFLTTYAMASILYQWIILIAILYGIHRFFQQSQLNPVGDTLILYVLSMTAIRWYKMLRQLRPSRTEMRYLKPFKIFVRGGMLIVLVLVLAIYPLPRSLQVPYTVEAVDAKAIHTVVDGELVNAVAESSRVRQGDWLATLSNSGLEREIQMLRAEEATLQSRLEQALNRRSSTDEIASQIPEIRVAIENARQRRELREQDYARLTLHAPMDGIVLAPRQKQDSLVDDGVDATGWVGTPLDPQNRGCYLSAGTEICSIGMESQRQIAAMVSQHDVELVFPGQKVRVFDNSREHAYLTACVRAIEPFPIADLPVELAVSGMIAMNPDGSTNLKPSEPVYRVAISLDAANTAELPVRSVGTARIQLERCSLWERIYRFLLGIKVE